jgi:hypothetical protein
VSENLASLPMPSMSDKFAEPSQVYHIRHRCFLRVVINTLVRSLRLVTFVARTDSPHAYHSGNIMKPSLDLIIFTSQLSRSLGFSGDLVPSSDFAVVR